MNNDTETSDGEAKVDEEDLWLGPFYDLDGTEILPCTTEATDAAIEHCMGNYRLLSNVPSLHNRTISITNRVMTEFIQEDWNRVMAGNSPLGFLAAYDSRQGQVSRRAVGRLAEDVVCPQVLKEDVFAGNHITKVLSVDDAIDQGLFVSSGKGIRCDDLVLVTQQGRKYLGEVKASFTGRSYLLSSLPKAVQQFQNSLAANADIEGVVFNLISIKEKLVVLLVAQRSEFETQPVSHWKETCRYLLSELSEHASN
jgi:hypothetical protein